MGSWLIFLGTKLAREWDIKNKTEKQKETERERERERKNSLYLKNEGNEERERKWQKKPVDSQRTKNEERESSGKSILKPMNVRERERQRRKPQNRSGAFIEIYGSLQYVFVKELSLSYHPACALLLWKPPRSFRTFYFTRDLTLLSRILHQIPFSNLVKNFFYFILYFISIFFSLFLFSII